MTRAEQIRAGKIANKSGKLSGVERTQYFLLELKKQSGNYVNGKVLNKKVITLTPFLHIDLCERFLQRLAIGYEVTIKNNPKKWLTGEKDIGKYDQCERVEQAVKAYNKRKGGAE